MSMKNTVLWDVRLCDLVDVLQEHVVFSLRAMNERFKKAASIYCLRFCPEDGKSTYPPDRSMSERSVKFSHSVRRHLPESSTLPIL